MHPHNIGQQFRPHLPEEVRNPDEYSHTMGKIARIAERHGEGYTVEKSPLWHKEGDTHSFAMFSPDGNWAGELTHDAGDGRVGHLYVLKEHRHALPKLITHAVNYALQTGNVPPQGGRDMTPRAERMFRNQLPATRGQTSVAITKPITTYGDPNG